MRPRQFLIIKPTKPIFHLNTAPSARPPRGIRCNSPDNISPPIPTVKAPPALDEEHESEQLSQQPSTRQPDYGTFRNPCLRQPELEGHHHPHLFHADRPRRRLQRFRRAPRSPKRPPRRLRRRLQSPPHPR